MKRENSFTPPVRHAQLKRSSNLKNFFKILLLTFLVIGLSSVFVLVYAYYTLLNQVEVIDIAPIEPVEKDEAPEAVGAKRDTIDGAYNLLIIGSDSRVGQTYQDDVDSELNDVTMLLQIDEDHSRIDIISFPRDIILPYSCFNPITERETTLEDRMINQALPLGGPACVASVVSDLVDEPIDSAVVVNFDSVMHLTTAIGGVPMCFTADVPNLNSLNNEILFTEGRHDLEGMDALTFLRERKAFYDGGDLGRVENQKLFIQSFLKKVYNEKMFLNLAKVYELANISMQNLNMTEDLKNPEMLISLANTVMNIPQNNIALHTIPTFQHKEDSNRLSINEEAWEELKIEINTPKSVIIDIPVISDEPVDVMAEVAEIIAEYIPTYETEKSRAKRLAKESEGAIIEKSESVNDTDETIPRAFICS